MSKLNLPPIAEKYLSRRVVTKHYSNTVRRIARDCRRLEVDAINLYLRKRLEEIKSVTAQHERTILVQLWRFAFEELGVIDTMPRGIVKIKVKHTPIKAWTIGQCCTAVKATFARDKVRIRSGARDGVFLRCWILLGYETGARLSDLWRLRDTDFDGNSVQWSQGKTGNPMAKVLSPACMQAVHAMLEDSPDGTVLDWAMTTTAACTHLKKFLRSMDMTGTSKWLRRSGATHIEMTQPGYARRHLGHRTVGLAEKHYIDWTQVNRELPKTPSLLE